jgi:hypothetical protein
MPVFDFQSEKLRELGPPLRDCLFLLEDPLKIGARLFKRSYERLF